jgi:hypothetical protein
VTGKEVVCNATNAVRMGWSFLMSRTKTRMMLGIGRYLKVTLKELPKVQVKPPVSSLYPEMEPKANPLPAGMLQLTSPVPPVVILGVVVGPKLTETPSKGWELESKTFQTFKVQGRGFKQRATETV